MKNKPSPPEIQAAKPYGKLRVWWIPQLGSCPPFHVEVRTLAEGKTLLGALAQYDLFQLDHNIKPDFANAGGLEYFSPTCVDTDSTYPCDGWVEFYTIDGVEIANLSFEMLYIKRELVADDDQVVRSS